jgi:hypothetical protein
MVGFNAHTVAWCKFIDALSQSDNCPGPLMTRGIVAKGGSLRKMSIKYFEICSTGTTESYFDQYLTIARPGNWSINHTNIARAK